MAELNGLEPSSAWLTTKCLTSQPQFLTIADYGFQNADWCALMLDRLERIRNPHSAFRNRNWVGRRELNPHGPQSQCGALPFELRPTQKGDKETNVTSHFGDVVTISIRPKRNASLACDDVEWPGVWTQTNSLRYRGVGRACGIRTHASLD